MPRTVPYQHSVLSNPPSIAHPKDGLPVPAPEDRFIQPIQIKVKNGRPVTVLVSLEMQVADFKGVVERVTGVAKDEQRFYQEDCGLPPCRCCFTHKEHHTLKHYNVKEVSRIAFLPSSIVLFPSSN